MHGTPPAAGWRARRTRGHTRVVRDVQDRHLVADERALVERRLPAGGERIGDLVGTLVARNTLVAADVVPLDLSRTALGRCERLPEVAVRYLLARCPPPCPDLAYPPRRRYGNRPHHAPIGGPARPPGVAAARLSGRRATACSFPVRGPPNSRSPRNFPDA